MVIPKQSDSSKSVTRKRFDAKEFEFLETSFIRDIDTHLLQGIVLQCLETIPGIAVIEGNFIDSIFGRTGAEKSASIIAEQDSKNHAVSIKVEVNIAYGISVPEKAEEIQSKIVEEITRLTGLHVANVHVVFRGLIPLEKKKKVGSFEGKIAKQDDGYEAEYNDDF
jgi:uncharacterized alkaline shock family protein YloU